MPGYGSYPMQVFNAQQSTIAAQRTATQALCSQALAHSPIPEGAPVVPWTRIGAGTGLVGLLAGCSGGAHTAAGVDPAAAVSAGNFIHHVFSDFSYTSSAFRGTWERVRDVFCEHPAAFTLAFGALAFMIWGYEKKREAYVADETTTEASRKKREKWVPHLGPSIMKAAVFVNGVEIAQNFNQPLARACHSAWGDVVVASMFLGGNFLLESAFKSAHERKKQEEEGVVSESRPSLSPEAIRKMQLALWFTCLLDDVALPILYMVRQAHP